ncbi:MAG: Phosphomannomutase [Candidatus Levybacteria bacterium GW2011_GWA2_40_8]|nr:MAG: Phosphomannomutase [Candidatus Levybacteria bacterium GW2011_GWA2_40_8]
MKINPSIFKAYDIRGLYPQDINKETIAGLIKAIYTFFVTDIGKENLLFVLSRDMRLSSPELFKKAKDALVSLGATVIDIGLSSTPTFYFALKHYQADCGVQISASHNPKEWNGLKFAKFSASKLYKVGKNTGMDKVRELTISENFVHPEKKGKVIVKQDTLEKELDEIFNIVKPVHLKKMKVVADPANAMGILCLNALVKRLPFDLIRMNFELDGTFPSHQPDPLQFRLLKNLQQKVLSEHADLGITIDGDGDRVFFIDENGSIIPATHISSLIASEILQKQPGEKIIVDIRYTKNVSAVCKQYNGKVSISKVGHALITEQLNRESAIFAGESSGHFYFRDGGGAESSLRVILMLLEIIGRENKPVSHILSKQISSFESGESNFILPQSLKASTVLDLLSNKYRDGQISYLDGIAVDYPSWRFNIRTSNTEPLLRLNVEANLQKRADDKLNEIKQILISQGASIKD